MPAATCGLHGWPSGKTVLPEQICFHAQQAAEKALKAILLAREVDFPFTHDLEELLTIFPAAGIAIPSELQEVGALTPYAVETRYPGFWGQIAEQEVEKALSLAQDVVDWAERMLNLPSPITTILPA